MVTRWAGAKYHHIYSWKGIRRPPIKRISPVLIIIHPDTSMVDVMEHFAPLSDQFWGLQRVRSPSELEITLFAPGGGPGGLLLTWYPLFCYISTLTHQWGMLWSILHHSQINSEVARGSGARPEPNTSYSPNEELQSDLRWSLRVVQTSGLVWQQPNESRNEARAR